MRILAVSDEEAKGLYDHYRPGKLAGYDLILSCGDLKKEYLEFLVTMSNVPLLYVPGNHDDGFAQRPPEGCECVDDEIVVFNGVRILGLGGSMRYRPDEPYMYTEKEMARRVRHLWRKLRKHRGFDILLTHAPARGQGDMEDIPHRGFETFLALLDRYKPRYLVYGHVHQEYGPMKFVRERHYGETTLVNAYKRYIIEI